MLLLLENTLRHRNTAGLVSLVFNSAILYSMRLSVYIANVCSSSTKKLSSFQLIHSQIWNVFDFSFVVVFIGYLTLRIKGLGHNDRKTSLLFILKPKLTAKIYLVAASEMAFQLLCCGACILFPR